jgi:hypothetical protein
MTIRGDISIDWSASPRVITVAAPSDTLSLQDLYDTLRSISDDIEAMDEPEIVEGVGKDQIGVGRYTGLTIRLYNAKVAFEARVAWTYCTVSGGNLVAVDEDGDPMLALYPTAYVNIGYEADVSAALLEGSGGATPEQIAEAVRTELTPELAGILRALGLMQENYCLDEAVYNADGFLVSGRIRTYTDPASVGSDDDVLATYQIIGAWSGAEMTNYQVAKQ